jgi:hypothetical protein
LVNRLQLQGVDVLIEALAQLNHQLKEAGLKITIVVFLLFPREDNGINQESLKAQGVANQVHLFSPFFIYFF